jgi:hypothetical protein
MKNLQKGQCQCCGKERKVVLKGKLKEGLLVFVCEACWNHCIVTNGVARREPSNVHA